MIALLLTLVIVGVVLYLIETYVPMSPPVKTVLRVVVVVLLILWLMRVFGLADIAVPRL
jgi:hypothetical protein